MALGGALGTAWARLVARDAAALSVAGVALGDIHLDFTWQTWHNLTSRSFCLAGVALMAHGWRAWSRVTLRHFAWQACHLVTSTLISRGRRGTMRGTHGTGWRPWARLVARDAAATVRGRRGTW